MDKTIKIEVPADEAAQVQVEIQHYLDEIEQSTERMKKGQAEIGAIKTRTRAMLAELSQLRGGFDVSVLKQLLDYVRHLFALAQGLEQTRQ